MAKNDNSASTPHSNVSAAIDVEHKDVVITDPMYLCRNELWPLVSGAGNTTIIPTIVTLGGVEMVFADTIYGDWMCAVHRIVDGDVQYGSRLGTFTADSGLVCAAVLGGAKPEDVLAEIPKSCYTVLHDFTGRVMITHNEGVCHVEGIGTTGEQCIEFTSRQLA